MLLAINRPEDRMAAKEAIVARRKEISLLLVRGVTQEVMAKQFGVTQRQIAEDIKRIRLSNKKFLERDGADGLLGELLSHQGPRRKMLWEIVDLETASNRERISALKALGEEDDRLMRIGLATGIVLSAVDPSETVAQSQRFKEYCEFDDWCKNNRFSKRAMAIVHAHISPSPDIKDENPRITAILDKFMPPHYDVEETSDIPVTKE